MVISVSPLVSFFSLLIIIFGSLFIKNYRTFIYDLLWHGILGSVFIKCYLSCFFSQLSPSKCIFFFILPFFSFLFVLPLLFIYYIFHLHYLLHQLTYLNQVVRFLCALIPFFVGCLVAASRVRIFFEIFDYFINFYLL